MSSLNSLQRGIRQRAFRQRQEAQRTMCKKLRLLRVEDHQAAGLGVRPAAVVLEATLQSRRNSSR